MSGKAFAGTRLVCAIHLLGNAPLLLLFYYWLGIGEASAAQLVWGAMVALGAALGALWLHGVAAAYFGAGGESEVGAAFRASLRGLAMLAGLAIATAAIYALLAYCRESSAKEAFTLASYVTLKLRKPLKPETVLRVFHGAFSVARWVIVPLFVLPLAADALRENHRALRIPLPRPRHRWFSAIEIPALLLGAIWVPIRLIEWVPAIRGFWMQMASFAARFTLAYLLFVGCWLAIWFLSSRGTPRESQANTVVSP